MAAKQLALGGIRVDLFRNLNDPKRAISNAHPLCEYQSASFVLRSDAPSEFTREVQAWLHRGLLQEADPSFWSGQLDAQGQARRADIPGVRFLPLGGFFAFLDSLMGDLLEHRVSVRKEQLVRMSRRSGKWILHDRHGTEFGGYDVVLCAFDALPRAARKASEKQLLETALPHSSAVIASAARAQMCSCMAVVLHFEPPLEVPYDTINFDEVPELQFAARNPIGQQHYRGISEKYDTWTVVATPAWSLEQRPNSEGSWDKNRVGREIVKAFCRAMRCNVQAARQIIPTFHWQGCSYITQVKTGEPCAFDGEVGLGWCGDIFGGVGPEGAFLSGSAAASVIAGFMAGSKKSVLPGEAEWGLREAREDEEDIVSIAGPATGRTEPSDGLDHTWKTSVRLARGEKIKAADSFKGYRKHGALGEDRYRHEEGPWPVPSAGMKLHCQKVDEGMLKLTGLSPNVQTDLLRAVFSPGATGTCGGLYNARTHSIEVGQDKNFSFNGNSEVAWSKLGLHGSHTVQWENLRGSVVEEVWNAIRDSSPTEVLENFRPDSIRVAFETMHGRSIRQGQTLCGWSRDRDRVDHKDQHPKVYVIVGAGKIWRGFKYRKEDHESLDVGLSSGDVLLRYGPALTWFSAVNGFEPRANPTSDIPFDFVHIWFQDHRQLKAMRPEVYDSIHYPPSPVASSGEYKWMQFAYTVLNDKLDSDGAKMVAVKTEG
jgi:predicted NAD/FAD-dependent oxidoreductase